MDNPFFVRGFKRLGDLYRDAKGFTKRQGAVLNAFVQILAIDQLHDQIVRSHVVERADVRMVQSGDRVRLSLEAVAEALARHLDRHFPMQARVSGAIHFAHAACADQGDYFVNTKAGAGGEGQGVAPGL